MKSNFSLVLALDDVAPTKGIYKVRFDALPTEIDDVGVSVYNDNGVLLTSFPLTFAGCCICDGPKKEYYYRDPPYPDLVHFVYFHVKGTDWQQANTYVLRTVCSDNCLTIMLLRPETYEIPKRLDQYLVPF